jgi:hypothetical protein
MTALSIQPPFPIFTDTDGSPLENGYIWLGTANQDPQGNPIAAYWDAALTITARSPSARLAATRRAAARLHGCTWGVRLLDPGAEQEWVADLRFAERQCFLRWRRVGSIKRHRQRLADHLPGVVSPEGDLHQRRLSEPEHLLCGWWERDVL